MKPHLKLSAAGNLLLLTDGISGLSQQQTRKFIKRHYGSLQAFAQRFDLPYQAVCDATRSYDSSQCGGRIADVRRLLGLPSSPSAWASRLQQNQLKRTGFKPAWFLPAATSAHGALA